MKSGGGSSGRLGVMVGQDWWTFLSTYADHTPILTVDAGSTSVSFSIAGTQVDAAAVEFARELADQAAKFAAEVERLHARHPDADGGVCEGGGRERRGGLRKLSPGLEPKTVVNTHRMLHRAWEDFAT